MALRLVNTSFVYKGCTLPRIVWAGDPDLVVEAEQYWLRLQMAKAYQHRWIRRGGTMLAFVNAEREFFKVRTEAQRFYMDNGISKADAEKAIFTAVLDALIADDRR